MWNPKTWFKEYQEDPGVYTKLKIGFASLIVLGVLLFAIGLAVSPDLRHEIGIGGAVPVTVPHESGHSPAISKGHKLGPGGKQGSGANPAHKQKKQDNVHRHTRQHDKGGVGKGHHEDNGGEVHNNGGGHHESVPVPVEEHPESVPPTHHESGESHSGSGGSGGQPSSPSPPSSGHPSEPEGGGETKPPPTESKPPVKVETSPPKVEVTTPKVEVEVNIPPVTNNPTVEAVTGTVNETVNGVTSTVEETVNGVGGELGVHVEVPEVCVINCH